MELKIFQNIKNALKDKHQAISINQISLNQLTPSKKLENYDCALMQLTKEFKGKLRADLKVTLINLVELKKDSMQ